MDNIVLNERLENNKELNVLLVSKIMEWSDLLKLSFLHDNFIVKAYDNFNLKEENGNFDLIVCKSDAEYSNEKFDVLKSLAVKISENNDKRVTVGYMYDKYNGFDIFSYKDSELTLVEDSLINFDVADICERTLVFHDGFSNSKCFVKTARRK